MSEIKLQTHNPAWSGIFEDEKVDLLSEISIADMSVHHIGSTSVENLAAKPIIDILVVVPEINQIDKYITRFENIGYESMGEYGIPGRRYFRKGSQVRTHHLHAFASGSHDAKRHITFRDYLVAYPEIAKEYQSVKYRAAELCNGDSEKYCELKNDFIVFHEGKAMIRAQKT